MTDTHIGVLESRGARTALIDGINYTVPDYVAPFVARRKDGEQVEFSFTEGDAGRKLTKIMRYGSPAPQKKEEKLPESTLVKVIQINEVGLKCRRITTDPALLGIIIAKTIPEEFGKLKNAGVKEGDEILVIFDNKGYFSLPADFRCSAGSAPPPAAKNGNAEPAPTPGTSAKGETEKPTTARPTPSPASKDEARKDPAWIKHDEKESWLRYIATLNTATAILERVWQPDPHKTAAENIADKVDWVQSVAAGLRTRYGKDQGVVN